MLKISNVYLLAIALFILTGILACDSDDMISTETTLISFGPSGVRHGDTIVVIGENLLRVDAVEFAPAERVPSSEFIRHTDARFQVIVPTSAEPGILKLHVGDEVIESKTRLNFEVIYTILDVTDEARPETDITITGTFLNWVESITFNENLVVTEFVSQSQEEIVVTVPLEAKTGRLTLQGGGSEPLTLETEDALSVTLPVVTSISPEAIRHTEEITITGTDLDLTREIIFPDGSSITELEQLPGFSATSIVLNVPATAVDGPITLVTNSGIEVVTEASISIILPSESGLSPTPVPVGEELTISGTDLDLVETLTFPGVAEPVSDFVSQSATEIKVIVPEGTISGFMKFTTIHGFEVTLTTLLELPGAGPTPLALSIFDDGLMNGWGNWGWVMVEDPSNEQVFDGTAAMKLLFASTGGAWEGIQFGNGTPLDVSAYSNLVFYLYGAPGSGGSQIMVKINDGGNDPGATVTVVEGEWTEYSIPISELNANGGTDNSWGLIVIQEFDQAGADVYLDYFGFR